MSLDIMLFRVDHQGRPDWLMESQRRRGLNTDVVQSVVDLDVRWRQCKNEEEQMQRRVGLLHKSVSVKKKAKEECEEEIQEKRGLQQEVKRLTQEASQLLSQREGCLAQVGNVVHQMVPPSSSSTTTPSAFSHSPFTSLHISNLLCWRELLVGGGFAVGLPPGELSPELEWTASGVALLEAVERWCHAQLEPLGFTPYAATSTSLDGASALEHAVLSQKLEQWVEQKQLPLSHHCRCRMEGVAGSLSAAFGISHQVAVVTAAAPHTSWQSLEQLWEQLVQAYETLQLPLQQTLVAAPLLPLASALSRELVVWLPVSQQHVLVAQLGNHTTFTSRCLNRRFGFPKMGDQHVTGETKQYVHTVCGTALVVENLVACLVEAGQQDGSVTMEAVLGLLNYPSKP